MKLPKSWHDVTIAQYQKCLSISTLYKDDHVERHIHLLALFSGSSIEEIEKINIGELVKDNSLQFLSDPIPEGKLAHTFKLKGKVFKASILTSGMEAGQFIDFSHVGKGCSAEELPYHMHELIAAMCMTRVDSHKANWWNTSKMLDRYVYEGFDKTCNDILDMPMTLAYPYYVFFCEVLKKLQTPILEFSQKQTKKNLKKMKKILVSA